MICALCIDTNIILWYNRIKYKRFIRGRREEITLLSDSTTICALWNISISHQDVYYYNTVVDDDDDVVITITRVYCKIKKK